MIDENINLDEDISDIDELVKCENAGENLELGFKLHVYLILLSLFISTLPILYERSLQSR